MQIINDQKIKRNCDDSWIWLEEKEGSYIVRSAYNCLQDIIGGKTCF